LENKKSTMTLLRLASRTVCRVGGGPFSVVTTSRTTTISAMAAGGSVRGYLGRSIKVSHYEYGWTADDVDENIKSIEKYCTQTFNKISPVVSFQHKVDQMPHTHPPPKKSILEDSFSHKHLLFLHIQYEL
jgi:uncharacterized short protein YbdD (DUF466 family)